LLQIVTWYLSIEEVEAPPFSFEGEGGWGDEGMKEIELNIK
jgi:hypothetical protein